MVIFRNTSHRDSDSDNIDSPVSVTMRIRHYFTQNQVGNHTSFDLTVPEKKFSTLPKQTKEKTSQTSPKKPLRTSNKKAQEEKKLFKSNSGAKLLSSQSLRISTSVPSLGNAKGLAETDGKVEKYFNFGYFKSTR